MVVIRPFLNMTESKVPEIKFPGSWEWIAVVCEGSDAAFARVSGSAQGLHIMGVWSESFQGPKPTPNDILSRLKNSLGSGLVRKTKVAIVLPESDYDTISLDDPSIKDLDAAQQRETLRWAIAPLVEFPMDRASVDVLIPAGSGRRQITAVVAPESVVAPWVIQADDQRVNVRALDILEAAQRNLAHLFEAENRALGLLVISGSRAQFTISASGVLLMTRRIDVGSLEELSDTHTLDRIGLEVQRTLDNFERQTGRPGGTQVLVVPGDRSELIVRHLSNELNLSIQLLGEQAASVFKWSESIVKLPQQWSHLEWLAIGAACRGASE
jgi:MSHA biogenesis protein MshI